MPKFCSHLIKKMVLSVRKCGIEIIQECHGDDDSLFASRNAMGDDDSLSASRNAPGDGDSLSARGALTRLRGKGCP